MGFAALATHNKRRSVVRYKSLRDLVDNLIHNRSGNVITDCAVEVARDKANESLLARFRRLKDL
jgi:hypothetical protein